MNENAKHALKMIGVGVAIGGRHQTSKEFLGSDSI